MGLIASAFLLDHAMLQMRDHPSSTGSASAG